MARPYAPQSSEIRERFRLLSICALIQLLYYIFQTFQQCLNIIFLAIADALTSVRLFTVFDGFNLFGIIASVFVLYPKKSKKSVIFYIIFNAVETTFTMIFWIVNLTQLVRGFAIDNALFIAQVAIVFSADKIFLISLAIIGFVLSRRVLRHFKKDNAQEEMASFMKSTDEFQYS